MASRCTHVGCPTQPNGPVFADRHRSIRTADGEVGIVPTLPAGGFGCPCHGGQYSPEGNRTSGPPVRGLDRYEYAIKNGRLVLGKPYSVSNVTGEGKDARIHKSRRAHRRLGADPLPLAAASLGHEGMAVSDKKSARRRQLEAAINYPIDWLEERSGLVGGIKYFLFRKVPGDTNWFHTLGSATLTAFLVQALTGVILAMYYKPDPNSAYQSIQHITNDVTLGWLVRGMHKWGASVFIILMFFHMARVFLFGAYKYPRELTWLSDLDQLTKREIRYPAVAVASKGLGDAGGAGLCRRR